MLRPLLKATLEQDYLFFFMRWILIIVFAGVVFISRGSLTPPFPPDRYSDILLALAVSVVVNILFGIVISVPVLRGNAPYMIMVADWVVAGMFTSLITQNPLMVVGILSAIIVSGVFRLGSEWGIVQALGVVIASGGAFFLEQAVNIRNVQETLQTYLPILLLVGVIIFVSLVWSNSLDENNSRKSRKMRAIVEETTRRLEAMRGRANALAEMGELLNSTLNYEKILDSCLDLGRFSLKDDPKQRVIAMVLLVETEEELAVANARGLQRLDLIRTFKAQQGLLANCIQETRTQILGEEAHNDPELGDLIAFTGIESALVIPLRVEYETYGMLVFGSTAKNAFNEDHIDTMQSLGVQACIALKNAVLIDSLKEEKERLIRIERGMRESLTRDLHDIPTQTMSALAMQLSMIPAIARMTPEKLPEESENLRGIALRFVEEMRYVMFAWRPLALESQGLGPSLEQLANKMKQTYKQPMMCQVDPEAQSYLSQEQQNGLFYLIEEASNNARKHAEASMIKVKVSLEGSNVVTKIMDNGKGFDVEKVNANYESRSSYGMINMSDRAEHIKGVLDLRSEIGKGTTITVRVPVELKDQKGGLGGNRRKLERPHDKPMTTKTAAKTGPLSPLS